MFIFVRIIDVTSNPTLLPGNKWYATKCSGLTETHNYPLPIAMFVQAYLFIARCHQ